MQNLRILLAVLALLTIGLTAFTQELTPSLIVPTPASTTSHDTIFIRSTNNDNLIFDHTIQPSETLYSIAKHYGLSVRDLFFFNPDLRGNTISPGQRLTIPLPKKSILRYQTKSVTPDQYYHLCYRVRKGDTAYKIAKTRFKMPVDTLLERNAVITHKLDIGQVLQVGYMKKSGIPAKHHNFKSNPDWEKERMEDLAYQKGTADRKAYQEYGTAYCKKSLKDRAGYSVLHRTAKIRSHITIKNPMTGKTVRAKVLGRIPNSVHTKNVIVVVTQQTAKALGAKDGQFYVWIKK